LFGAIHPLGIAKGEIYQYVTTPHTLKGNRPDGKPPLSPIHAHHCAAHALPTHLFIFEVNVLILPCCQGVTVSMTPMPKQIL